MGANRPDETRISRYEWYISDLPGKPQFVRSRNTVGLAEHSPTSGWVIYERWRTVTGSGYEITYISACMRNSNEIPTAIPMFSMSSNMHNWTDPNIAVCRGGCMNNQRWRSITGNGYGITYISACIHDSNKIPTHSQILGCCLYSRNRREHRIELPRMLW